MLGRLIVGILKGLIVGGLIGFGLVKLGFALLPAWLAYIAAAITGVVIGLIAGKPIWAKDAKIEAGMKAVVGALLGAGLMFAARKWLTMYLPTEPLSQIGVMTKSEAIRFGYFPITSLATIAAVLGGFYDADNTPGPEGEAEAKEETKAPPAKAGPQKRIAQPAEDELDEDFDTSADEKKAKK
ncbi:hypothetical protein [Polyangium jinanense]|uniref:Uncharacterized protein n=1 Tax=Polyangium jinanense TaxID=2829994 RepID=A0A9X4AS47_9BACT|nr:hypothetical protein [Polyangium jinanense]MDC3954524.1 hypothetical protein [Polyangium jinanense]MDC3980827.1 hypothetical protein [Polyangium jinanense]